jgi:RNA polymerase primary sigma factor
LSATLPLDQLSSEEIEDTMTMLSELGMTESDESEEPVAPEGEPAKAGGNLDHDDIGRTDDPVRMYLRQMRSVQLLSREGEVVIAKRIEAGREMMLGAIRESPLTFDAILGWRDALNEGQMLLRDIIDLDATYGGGFDRAVVFTPREAMATPPAGVTLDHQRSENADRQRHRHSPVAQRESVQVMFVSRKLWTFGSVTWVRASGLLSLVGIACKPI